MVVLITAGPNRDVWLPGSGGPRGANQRLLGGRFSAQGDYGLNESSLEVPLNISRLHISHPRLLASTSEPDWPDDHRWHAADVSFGDELREQRQERSVPARIPL